MSLNRSEQLTLDYLNSHPDERHHWQDKVQRIAAEASDDHAASARLAGELWRYFEERSTVVTPFLDLARREGLRRTSMKNLAEYLIRMWTVRRIKNIGDVRTERG